MVIFDYIFFSIIISFFIFGFYVGLIKGISKFLTLLIPISITYFGSENINHYLNNIINFLSWEIPEGVSSIISFIIFYFLLKILFFIIESITLASGLSLFNRITGALTSTALGLIVGYLFLIILFKFFNIESYMYNSINEFIKIKVFN